MTRELFDAQMGRLIVLKGWPDSVDEHFGALKDIPPDVFTAAVDHALKTRAWFPVPAEIRADADVVARVVVKLEPEPEWESSGNIEEHFIANPFGGKGITVKVDRDWKYYCDACNDTGMASKWCGEDNTRFPWLPLVQCDRRGKHFPHDWVAHCLCVEWNPTVKRRKDAQLRTYSEKPARSDR